MDGADVTPYRYLYSHMWAGHSREKKAVLSHVMINTLAVSLDCLVEKDYLELVCKILDSSGQEVGGANVMFRLTPGDFSWKKLEQRGNGYFFRLLKKDFPVFYDVVRKEYRTLQGKCRMIIRAESGNKQGGTIFNLTI